ncbi:MAG: hypothetical protein KDK51_07250 [Deltaproteobacteria bacterium]|nr:hypothetical protein [Deltaproteobacteria bacterium]
MTHFFKTFSPSTQLHDHEFSSFEPSGWIKNRHFQTIVGSIFKTDQLSASRTFEITIDDKKKSLCQLFHQGSSKLVLLFHGLGGKTDSAYLMRTARTVLSYGYDVACLSLPGNQDRSPYLYHAGDSDFFDAVLAHFRPSYKTTHWVGFSFSGNLILQWLKTPKEITTAVVVSPVTDLQKSVQRIDAPSQWIYR